MQLSSLVCFILGDPYDAQYHRAEWIIRSINRLMRKMWRQVSDQHRLEYYHYVQSHEGVKACRSYNASVVLMAQDTVPSNHLAAILRISEGCGRVLI